MLSKLLGKQRWTHRDPDVRLAAVTDLDTADPAHADALSGLARADDDPRVRVAAIARLQDSRLLLSLLEDPEARVQRAAAERCAHLAADGQPQLLEHGDVAWRVALAGGSVAVLEHISDEARLVDLAVQARTAAVRQAAAARVNSIDGLTRLAREARSRDKSAWRTARSRLAAAEAAREAQAGAVAAIQTLIEQAADTTAHDTLPPDAGRRVALVRDRREAAFSSLEQANNEARQWTLPMADPAPLAEALDSALDTADAALDEAAAAQPPPADTPDAADTAVAAASGPAADGPTPETTTDPGAGQPTDAPAPPSDADRARYEAELEAAALALETLHERLRRQPDTWLEAGSRADFDAIEQRWLAASDHVQPQAALAQAQHDREHHLRTGLAASQRLLEQLLSLQEATGEGAPAVPQPEDTGAWAELWDFQASARRRAQALARLERSVAWPDDHHHPRPDVLVRAVAVREALEAADQAIHDRHEQLKTDVRDAENALDQALTAGDLAAARNHFKACRDLVQRLPKGSARRLQRRFGSLAHQLHELQDWQTFATHPKREELATAMANLRDQPQPPPEQADAIRALRKEWNDLGPVASSEDHRLAKAFNDAAEAAFEPCRAWYREQAEQRAWNLENRQKILAELERYLADTDWSGKVDWKAAERILRAARKEWQRYSPVDRKAGRKIEQAFNAAADALHGHLTAEYGRNLARKEAIVAQAEALLEDTAELRERTNTAKGLQADWKRVGPVPRRPDQALWSRFRKACDALFAAREAEHQDREASAGTARAAAEALCMELETRVRELAPADAEPGALRQAEQQFHDALEGVPPRGRRPLEQRFRGAADEFRRLLRDKARLTDLETGRRLLAAHDDLDSADLDGLPGALRQRLDPEARAATDADAAAEARHRLTIRLEILAGVESPADDQALRLQTQVERLNSGLGGSADEPGVLELLVDWLNAGPATPKDGELARRADQALVVACRG